MKLRFLAALIAVLMLFSLSACAAEAVNVAPVGLPNEITRDSAKFVFRNGVTWGASQEEVQATETGECISESFDEFDTLLYSAVSVSKYSAKLRYIFYEDSLVCTLYYFDELPTNDFDYLIEAISSKYGMPVPSSPSRQLTLMNVIEPSDDYELYHLTNWELNDGTYIALHSMDENAEDGFFLVYSNEDALLSIGGIYNTEGL